MDATELHCAKSVDLLDISHTEMDLWRGVCYQSIDLFAAVQRAVAEPIALCC